MSSTASSDDWDGHHDLSSRFSRRADGDREEPGGDPYREGAQDRNSDFGFHASVSRHGCRNGQAAACGTEWGAASAHRSRRTGRTLQRRPVPALGVAGDRTFACGGARAARRGGTGLYVRTLAYGLWEGPPADWGLRRQLLEEEVAVGSGHLWRRLAQADPALAATLHARDRN